MEGDITEILKLLEDLGQYPIEAFDYPKGSINGR